MFSTNARAQRALRAFTLIELLVVVAILALLVSVLLPSLSEARRRAKRAVTLAHLRGIGIAMAVYENENRDEHPALLTREEKAFLGLSLLGRQHQFPAKFFVNPNTTDTPPQSTSPDGRPVLADVGGVEAGTDTSITPMNIAQVKWHCSYAYDNDVKHPSTTTLLPWPLTNA